MHELFDNDYLNSLGEQDPLIGIQKLCEKYLNFYQEKMHNDPIDTDDYNTALHAYSFIYALNKKWDFDISPVQFGGNRRENVQKINSFINHIIQSTEQKYSSKMVELASQKYDVIFGNEFYYEIEEDDFKIIQKDINELRDLIKESEHIPDEHKRRLLKRLEELQIELNKRMSNFDKYFGIAIEISSYVGEFCENIKPFNDRLREMLDIVAKAMKISSGKILLEENNPSNSIDNE